MTGWAAARRARPLGPAALQGALQVAGVPPSALLALPSMAKTHAQLLVAASPLCAMTPPQQALREVRPAFAPLR